jgi:primary-amine oxidase
VFYSGSQISIIEPPKNLLRAFLVAERNGRSLPSQLPRCASALYYHRGTSNLFLAKLNLDANYVEKIQQLQSHFHGQADIDEAILLRDICLEHPKVLEEVKKFKLPDHLTLVCDTWPYGRDSKDHHPRLVQVSCYCPSKQYLLITNSAISLLVESTRVQTITTSHFHFRQSLI